MADELEKAVEEALLPVITELRRHPLAKCEQCPLNDPANGFVPSQFPATGQASLAVVGEAPGFQETAYKRPFMGPSGKLIKKVLQHHEIDRNDILFTNACLCRPPDNATPPRAAIAACRGRLMAEIRQSGAGDVLALGATAAAVLVDSPSAITKLRIGPPKSPVTELQNTVEKVVPTWHPAYCLRNADSFPALVSDVGKLKEKVREPWTPPRWVAFDDPTDALRAIAELRVRTNTLVVDIEVGVDKDESFFHPNEFDMLCVGLAYAKGQVVVIGETALRDEEVRSALGELLRSKFVGAHNSKFDFAGLQPICGPIPFHFDTMLGSYALDERPGIHALEYIAVEKLGAPSWKSEIKQYIPKGDKNYANIPRPILYKYNAYDAANTWDIWEWQQERLNRKPKEWPYPWLPVKSLRDVHDFLVAAANQLIYPELNGMPVDLPYNFTLGDEFSKRIGAIEGELNEIISAALGDEYGDTFPRGFNPRSPLQIRKYLAAEGLNTDSTDKDAIAKMQSKVARGSFAGQFLSTLLRHRREQKLYSTYVVGIRKRVYRGRVYTTYLLHGTTSGRLASRNPNLQNVVRDKAIKRQFVTSKPGNVLVHCDYAQAELRVISTLAKDTYFRDILADPEQDLFTELVCQLYKVTKAEALNGSSKSKEMRIRIKAFVYGLGYGREPGSIAAEFKIPMSEAYKLRDDFFKLIPEIVKWQADVRRRVHRDQELISPFGRRRRFHLITEQNQKDVENEALSFLPQSTASDICLRALVRVRPMLRGLGYLRLTIHDALVVETTPTKVQEVQNLLMENMVQSGKEFTDWVPFRVDVTTGPSWGDL